MLVELGTHSGTSYFSFCKAVRQQNLSTVCFAVDTWTGDEHAGFYDDAVFNSVNEKNQQFHFSTLLRKTFDEALHDFRDGSIDLLHIDGLHTYEAVKRDFEQWLPKMSNRGLVLFHDIAVKDRGFGVYLFWDEISRQYPQFSFEHGFGLGCLEWEKINQTYCISFLNSR